MMGAVGILCDRVRLEEKELLEAMRLEGLPAETFAPTAAPLPIGPSPRADAPFLQCAMVLDRCRDRTSAGFLISVAADYGLSAIGGGIAATGNRLEIARRLARTGISRPETLLVSSEEAGLAALRSLGYPATLFSLSPSKRPQRILDDDIAEALLEHRHTLLAPAARTMLVQAGAPTDTETATIVVVDGVSAAVSAAGRQSLRESTAMRMAEEAALALNATLVGVQLAEINGELVVWDVDPVPDFRGMALFGVTSVGLAVASLAKRLLNAKEAEHGLALQV